MSGDVTTLITAVSNLGSLGILVFFLMWKSARDDERRAKRSIERDRQQLLADERRITLERERLEADKALAASLAALTSAIQSRMHE